MKDDTVKIGLLGLGHMGQNHLRNLVIIKQVELAFIYDNNEALKNKLADQFKVKAANNLEEELKSVDAVIIVTPTNTHIDYINLAVEYVKYIFVEKPLTNNLVSTLEVTKMAKEKDIKFQVGFIERYNPAVTALEKIIKNSNNVINIDFSRTNKVRERKGNVDVVLDVMIHDIDLALHLNGKPQKIDAHGYIKNGITEYARANIIHVNGRFSNIVASRITEKKIRQISATCDDMYIDCRLMSKEVFVNKQTVQQYIENISISSREETVHVRPQEGLLLELMDFVKLCNGSVHEVPNEFDALNAMEVAVEIQQIILEGYR